MILVTGATGLVGGHLLWQLLQVNEQVVAVRREKSNADTLKKIFSFYTSEPETYLARINWRIADVLDKKSLNTALSGVSYIYHCAGMVSFGDNADILFETNVAGTRNIVDISLEKNIRKFCFVSSISAIGSKPGTEYIDEEDKWFDHPERTLYSRSKYYAEQEVWKGIGKGLNAVIVNPGVILGFSGNDTGSARLFHQVRKGLFFYTNGGSGYVCVQDVARAMIELMNSNVSGESFILVGENCSNKEILSWIAEGYGKRKPFIPVGKTLLLLAGSTMDFFAKVFHFHPLIDKGTARTASGRKYYSNKKIKKYLGFEFTPVKHCIMDITDTFRSA